MCLVSFLFFPCYCNQKLCHGEYRSMLSQRKTLCRMCNRAVRRTVGLFLFGLVFKCETMLDLLRDSRNEGVLSRRALASVSTSLKLFIKTF